MAQWQDIDYVMKNLLRKDISLEESQELYRLWAETGTYDKLIDKDPKTYAALSVLSRSVEDLWPKDALILDVGAGTGLSGMVMQQCGYNNLHALEPQPNLASIAREKGIYKHIVQEFIGAEEAVKVDDGTYDGIVCTGAFGPGHIPTSAIPEMIRLVKSGGFIVNCMREEYFWTVPDYKDRLQPLMNQMEQEGKWKCIEREVYPNHFGGLNGVMFKYQVC